MMIHIIFKKSLLAIIKKNLLALLFCAISLTNAMAQITLGYCEEEDSGAGLTNSNIGATISVAMGVTPELQAGYTYCAISYLHIYLTEPGNFTSFNAWIRKDLNDTENLTSIDVDPSTLSIGWNDIVLPDPPALNGSDTYYCGYSYQQSVKTRIPTSGSKGTSESFYAASGDNWRDMSTKQAPVCIRAGLTSSYQNAIELNDLSLDQRYFDIQGGKDSLTLSGTIRNLGNERLHHFSISVQDNGSDSLCADYECDSTVFGDVVPFTFKFLHGDNGNLPQTDIPIVLNISKPNDAENENSLSTSDTLYYEIGQSIPNASTLMIEEFTSEANGYAPAGQTHLRNSIAQAIEQMGDQAPEVILLSRHEGYGPADAWRIGNSDYEANFFGTEALAYAPAAFINREGLPFSTTISEDSIAELIAQQANEQYGEIKIEGLSLDTASHTVSATLQVQLTGITRYRNPTLVVCLKQDRIASVSQKNYYPDLYNSDWQCDLIRRFFSLSNKGKLLGNLDINAVAKGQIQVSDYNQQQFTISEAVPSDITTKDGLTLVAYIFDKDYTNRIIAVTQAKF